MTLPSETCGLVPASNFALIGNLADASVCFSLVSLAASLMQSTAFLVFAIRLQKPPMLAFHENVAVYQDDW